MSPEQGAGTIASRLDKLYEFEREPVTADKLHGGHYFAAMFAGEHVAGTEFVIGALFVQWGATARDLVFGLLLGNLLAVLSWAFICAPIAVRTRLTLYWYVRRIIGPGLTVVYNFVNAVLYCCLAAAMIGVSASAIGLACSRFGLKFRHPELDDVLPNSAAWVVIVLLVGAAVIVLAIAGFKRFSQFSAVCSPWMFPIFVAGALATLPQLGEFHSLGDLWTVAQTKVWTGEPLKVRLDVDATFRDDLDRRTVSAALREKLAAHPKAPIRLSPAAVVLLEESGRSWRIADQQTTYVVRVRENQLRVAEVLKERLGFWHILFFAWFCNLAMHVGLSDLAVFRYAKHWSYGFYSAFGMYLGHYAAWMCAGIMGAVVWGEVNPGKMADTAAGTAGLICVLLAGWTTANPTIYRAGLALQIITPNWPRWLVTLAAGAITTIVALFPAIFMQLLDFVAIYGLMVMPIGAIIVTEHWLFPKLGLPQYWTEKKRLAVNPAALISWLAVLVLCFPIEKFANVKSPAEMLGVHLFFRWLPGWFVAAGLYTLLCFVLAPRRGVQRVGERAAAAAPVSAAGPARPPQPPAPLSPVAWIAGAVALLSLVLCIVLPVQVFLHARSMESYKQGLLAASVVYFVAGTVWYSYREKARAQT